MRKLSELLSESIEQKEIARAGRAQRIIRRWEEAVGPYLAAKSQPDRFDHGTLWVAAAGSSWAQEIRLQKEMIITRLNQMASENLFTDLRVGARKPQRDWSEESTGEI